MIAPDFTDDPYLANIFVKAGSLFMSIQWLQSRMAWLLTLKEVSERDNVPVANLWYCEEHWGRWQSCMDRHGQNFSEIARAFVQIFPDAWEDGNKINLHCLVCMRNMLAHSSLSSYQRQRKSGGEDVPFLVYVPRKQVSKDCRNCPAYHGEESPSGVTISLGAQDLEEYSGYLKTQQEVVKRVAASLDLAYIDLY